MATIKAYLDHLPPTSYISLPRTWRVYRVPNSTAVWALTCFLQVYPLWSKDSTVCFPLCYCRFLLFSFRLIPPPPPITSYHYWCEESRHVFGACVRFPHICLIHLPLQSEEPGPVLIYHDSNSPKVTPESWVLHVNTPLTQDSLILASLRTSFQHQNGSQWNVFKDELAVNFVRHKEETVGKRPTSSFLTLKELLFP